MRWKFWETPPEVVAEGHQAEDAVVLARKASRQAAELQGTIDAFNAQLEASMRRKPRRDDDAP